MTVMEMGANNDLCVFCVRCKECNRQSMVALFISHLLPTITELSLLQEQKGAERPLKGL